LTVTGRGQALVAAAPPVPIREIFRRFWPYARPYRGWFMLTLVFIALVSAVDTAMIWMFKLVVDEVLVPLDFGPLLWIALAYLGLTLLDGLVSFLDDYLSTWVGECFLLSLRTNFFRHLQDLSLDFFERRKLGDEANLSRPAIRSRPTSTGAAPSTSTKSGARSKLVTASPRFCVRTAPTTGRRGAGCSGRDRFSSGSRTCTSCVLMRF
jgi:ABC-type bacteriocin/lantibiotic exporter with double-glycine peptidase domain